MSSFELRADLRTKGPGLVVVDFFHDDRSFESTVFEAEEDEDVIKRLDVMLIVRVADKAVADQAKIEAVKVQAAFVKLDVYVKATNLEAVGFTKAESDIVKGVK